MYRVLESKLAFYDISKKRLADELGINYNTLLSKMAGKSSFNLDEALCIKHFIKEDIPIEELFKDE